MLNLTSLVPITLLGLLYYNQHMYHSERFGGNKTLVGAAFTGAACAASLLSSFATNKETHDEQVRKENKRLKKERDILEKQKKE